MVELTSEDVIRGLKRLKSLAKQDILASALTKNPAFWSKHAGARKEKYEELITLVEKYGVSGAYEIAARQYSELPHVDVTEGNSDAPPEIIGQGQALKLFFSTLGVDERSLNDIRQRRAEGSN
ncbi:MAG TPA: hypothetical protein GXX51_01070 [Firmicutes bacterium]|nr:hypothetical protein [Bacillota bacterium]